MINLLLGVSGGGKSYEATKYHIFPALEAGRKVITNLPLNLDAFAAIDPGYRNRIIKRTKPQPILGNWQPADDRPAFDLLKPDQLHLADRPPKINRAFAGVWDYYITEDDKNDQGQGPLFVIDECQLALPAKYTAFEVEEWYSLHRHYNVDVLLITQSYGKISQAVRDNVQIVYRVRKNVAFGSTGTYTRKVQDGIGGEVVNTSVRKYDPAIFGLYKSHTQGQAVDELNANDIVPLWRRWPFIGFALCVLIVLYMVTTRDLKNPIAQGQEIARKAQAHTIRTVPPAQEQPPLIKAASPVPPAPAAGGEGPPLAGRAPDSSAAGDDLLEGRGVHILLHIRGQDGREMWKFGLSQNGQGNPYMIDLADLKQAGYSWHPFGDCLGQLKGHGITRNLSCDAPTYNATVGGVHPEPGGGMGAPAPHVDTAATLQPPLPASSPM